MMLAIVPPGQKSITRFMIMRPFFVGIADMGVSSLTWLIAIHLHAEWSSHYVCSCYARSYNNVPGGHSDTIYVTAYMQMMVVCIYVPVYYSKVVSTKPYILYNYNYIQHAK